MTSQAEGLHEFLGSFDEILNTGEMCAASFLKFTDLCSWGIIWLASCIFDSPKSFQPYFLQYWFPIENNFSERNIQDTLYTWAYPFINQTTTTPVEEIGNEMVVLEQSSIINTDGTDLDKNPDLKHEEPRANSTMVSQQKRMLELPTYPRQQTGCRNKSRKFNPNLVITPRPAWR